MGLDCSHGAFSGSYSSFNRFRKVVAKAMGGTYPPHEEGATYDDGKPCDPRMWYWGDNYGPEIHPGLLAFFNHSDCDGEFDPEMAALVADDLEELLPLIEKLDDGGGGHIKAAGGYVAVTKQFIAGCRHAAAAGEPLEFH